MSSLVVWRHQRVQCRNRNLNWGSWMEAEFLNAFTSKEDKWLRNSLPSVPLTISSWEALSFWCLNTCLLLKPIQALRALADLNCGRTKGNEFRMPVFTLAMTRHKIHPPFVLRSGCTVVVDCNLLTKVSFPPSIWKKPSFVVNLCFCTIWLFSLLYCCFELFSQSHDLTHNSLLFSQNEAVIEMRQKQL